MIHKFSSSLDLSGQKFGLQAIATSFLNFTKFSSSVKCNNYIKNMWLP